ncbi:MAG TPA: hypothetical protein VGR62_18265 [Candidatus Binatia bacterium]|nr:hypothetical protein [Candidatus Binatia bacterium]
MLAIVGLPLQVSYAFDWHVIGPRGGSVRSIAVDADPTVLYATGIGSIARSIDSGATWVELRAFDGVFLDVAADPSTPGTAYATQLGEVYCGPACATLVFTVVKTIDGFSTWSTVHTATSPLSGLIHGRSVERAAIAVDPTSPQTVHVGGLVRSLDGGATWSVVSGVYDAAWSMLVDPAHSNIVLAASGVGSGGGSGGLYRSTDGGVSFTPVGGPATSLARDDATGVLYAASDPSILRSLDGGVTWTPIAPLPSQALAVAARDSVIWATTEGTRFPDPLVAGSVFRSDDGGASWEERTSGVPHLPLEGLSVRALAQHPTASTLWLGMDDFGVFRNDDGIRWRAANNGFERLIVRRLTIDPTPPATVWAATNKGLFRSRDRGASWAPASEGLGTLIAEPLAFDPFQPETMLAASPPFGAGLFQSTDAGTTWHGHSGGLGASAIDIGAIAYDPVTPGTVYLGHKQFGLSKSVDGGNTWTNTTPANFSNPTALLIDPNVPSTLYAAANGAAKSVDGGSTWAPANSGLPRNDIRALVLDPNDTQRLYAAVPQVLMPPALMTTTDGAGSWASIPSVPFGPSSLAVHPATSVLYAGGIAGTVVASPPGGTSWTTIGDTLQFNVITMAFETTRGLLFAGGAHNTIAGDAAWIQLTPCAADAECDDGNACTTDSCDVPTGTCSSATRAEGTSCTTSDGCDDGVCTSSACRPRPCGVCDGAADADGDRTTDSCDPSDGALAITLAKITARPTNGTIQITGQVVLGPFPDAFAVTGDLTLRIDAGGGPIASVTWPRLFCLTRSNGRVTCTSADRRAKLEVKPAPKTPAAPKLTVKVRGLTIPTVPSGPLHFTLTQARSAIQRIGEIATCSASSSALKCRAP